MQRLYLQFYVTILVVLAVFVGAAVLLWRLADDDNRTPQYLDVAAELTGALLPDSNAPRPEQQRAIEALQRKLRFDIALYEPDGDMIAMAGKPPPRFEPVGPASAGDAGPAGRTSPCSCPTAAGWWRVRCASGPTRSSGSPRRWRSSAIAVAVGSFPVVRGLGRRLERLQAPASTGWAAAISARA